MCLDFEVSNDFWENTAFLKNNNYPKFKLIIKNKQWNWYLIFIRNNKYC